MLAGVMLRSFLMVVVATAALVAVRQPGSAVEISWPIRSGLPWRSGVSGAYDGFEKWRGRSLDVYVAWHPHRTWEEFREANANLIGNRLHGEPGRLSMGIAMIPKSHRGQFAECARGDFDDNYRVVAEKLVGWGRRDAILRIGWEANGSGFPWNMKDDVENYIACFRRIVEVMREVSEDFVIEWTMKKDSEGPRSIAEAWPGDDVVDIVGIDYYDGFPAYDSVAAWQGDFMSRKKGGPRGLGAWLEFARSKGKKLAVPEWGIRKQKGASTDNPLFITQMVEFFQENAADLAYEAYYNPRRSDFYENFSIFPPDANPQAAARYLELYANGG